MVVGDLVAGVHAQPLAALDVGVDRAALDRPGAHDRDLDREVVEVLRARAPQRGHLRAALDLEDAGRLGVLDRVVDLGGRRSGIRERSIRSPRARGDLLDAALDRGEHPEAEQVDLQEARVGAGVLVPLTIWRPSIAAGTTGQQSTSGRVATIIPPGCWERWRGRP